MSLREKDPEGTYCICMRVEDGNPNSWPRNITTKIIRTERDN